MIKYEDFSLKIEPKRGEVYPVIVLRSPAGEGRSSLRLPFDPDEIGDILFDLGRTVRGSGREPLRDVSPAATRTRPQRIGDQLFNTLFSGPVRSLLDRSLGMIHGRQRGLRIKLHIDPEDPSLAQLASLPWEFLYRKETRDFLNLSRFTPILRYLDVQRPYIPLPLEPPLRILVVISAPTDYARLDLDRERALIEESWARQGGVQVEFMEQATILALQDRLVDQPYHVLHYMGHGDFDERTGQGVLVMEDEDGRGALVDGSTLGVLLRDLPTMRLVFLNACETARVTKEKGLDPFAGVATAMVMAGIPAVVAMQFPISDSAAITFSQKFYPLLARGDPVDTAVAEGRRAIRLAETRTMEWGTPVLFMRAPQGVIFRVSEAQREKVPLPQIPELPEEVDEALEQRLTELYTRGLSAFWLEEWEKAARSFQAIVNVRPDYEDAADKLAEAKRQAKLHVLYAQAQAAQEAEDWSGALAALEELAAEAADFKDTAERLQIVRKQKQLADLYAEAQRLHQAQQWQAVVNVFGQIQAIEPDYADPDELLPTAEREVEGQKRQAKLNNLYSRAVRGMDARRWQEARQLLAQMQEMEPGFRETERLLARVEAEIEREETGRRRQDQIAALYEQALGLARDRQWRQALAVMEEIQSLDPQFADSEGIAARAREEVTKEEEEIRRQNELAALYAEAVQLLRAGQYQEALEKWEEVRARDPQYLDRQNVERRAREKLQPPAEAAPPKSRLPRWAIVAIGGLAMVAIVAVVVLRSRVPGGGRIAFASDRDGNWEIYVMNADGSGLTNLTNNPAKDRELSWSPDGRRIAFTSDRDGNQEIYVMNADGSEQINLTNNPDDDWYPSWSPDGSRITFTSDRDGPEIYTMNADGSGQTNLTNNPAHEWGPSWSPDGRQITFVSNRDGNDEIYVMSADGGTWIRLTNNPADDWHAPWSPDGSRITFASTRDGNPEIYVMNADGSGQANLTSNPADDWAPCWSPDNLRIVFTSYRDGNNEIYVMNTDGSEVTRLTNNPADDNWPSWGP